MTDHTRVFTEAPITRTTILANQARQWAYHVLRTTELRREFVWRTALTSLRFTSQAGAKSLAVPRRLCGTKDRQEALQTLSELPTLRYHRLQAALEGERVLISYADVVIGALPSNHAPWIQPLLERGAAPYLTQIEGKPLLHCTVAIGNVIPALDRLAEENAPITVPRSHSQSR